MPTCIYTKAPFEESTKEHILQNSLGARWVSNQIVCNEAQEQFGGTIDRELEEAIRPIRMLVGSKSGRKNEAPPLENIEAENGKKFHFEAGGKPVAVEPSYELKKLPDGKTSVTLKVNHASQLEWALHKLRKDHPGLNLGDLNPREILKTATKEEEYLQSPVKLGFSLGGESFYRAILKACFNLLGANSAEIALLPEFDSAREFILNGTGHIPDFARIVQNPSPTDLPIKGDFGHIISIYSKGPIVEATCVLFGSFQFSLRLSAAYRGPEFTFCYSVDPLRETDPAEDRDITIDPEKLPNFEDQAFTTPEAMFAATRTMFEAFMKKYMDRAQGHEVRRIIEKHLLPHEGELVTEEMLSLVAHDVAKFAVRGMRPRTPPSDEKGA